jgi:hypothetical protein
MPQPSKKAKTSKHASTTVSITPLGLKWDQDNYSCAYDTLLPVLFQVWRENPTKWTKRLRLYSEKLVLHFEKLSQGKKTFEQIRDQIRSKLHRANPRLFPYGRGGTDIDGLAEVLLTSNSALLSKTTECPSCKRDITKLIMTSFINTGTSTCEEWYMFRELCEGENTTERMSVNSWLQYYLTAVRLQCKRCSLTIKDEVSAEVEIHTMPPIIGMHVYSLFLKIDQKISLQDKRSKTHLYALRAIIYFGHFHFVCRIVDRDGYVWYNDGMTTGSKSNKDKRFEEYTQDELYKITLNVTHHGSHPIRHTEAKYDASIVMYAKC